MDPITDPLDPTTTTATPTDAAPRGPLTDAELAAEHPSVAVLVAGLEIIAGDAPYLADPRQGVKRIAVELVNYFRSAE